jgi:ubiquinone/menaquinone biosynthesis C-methylase UbiE
LEKLKFVTGDAQEIPFKDSTFDRVFSTCLLHHVDDVLQVLLETRRVTTTGGEIAFLLPTDPGILNQFIKKHVSYPKLKKLTNIRPGLFYALEHKNHVVGILELIRFVFQNDDLKFHYRPFGVRSWNLNLYIVAKIVKLDDKVSLRELIT